MKKSNILTLYDYNYWANARVLDATERITPAQFIAPANLSHGSGGTEHRLATLVHTLGAEVVWRLRCQAGVSPSALPTEAEFPTVEHLRVRWRVEEQATGKSLPMSSTMARSPGRKPALP